MLDFTTVWFKEHRLLDFSKAFQVNIGAICKKLIKAWLQSCNNWKDSLQLWKGYITLQMNNFFGSIWVYTCIILNIQADEVCFFLGLSSQNVCLISTEVGSWLVNFGTSDMMTFKFYLSERWLCAPCSSFIRNLITWCIVLDAACWLTDLGGTTMHKGTGHVYSAIQWYSTHVWILVTIPVCPCFQKHITLPFIWYLENQKHSSSVLSPSCSCTRLQKINQFFKEELS